MTEAGKQIQRVLDCPDVSYNGINLPTLARVARDLGSPTTGGFAEYLWRLSNDLTLPVEYAARFMRAAGYEPFVGYPLRPIAGVPGTETAASGVTALPVTANGAELLSVRGARNLDAALCALRQGKELQLTLKPEDIAYPHGLSISVEGFRGDIGHEVPSQIFVEVYEGSLRVHVWNGEEDPACSTTIERALFEAKSSGEIYGEKQRSSTRRNAAAVHRRT